MSVLDNLRAHMRELRTRMRESRPKLIDEALELFNYGLDRDEVYLELRDRYIDSIPAIASAADAAVDWDDVIRGAGGDLLEAIDGKVVDGLLRLIVQAADRRRERRRRGGVLLGDLLRGPRRAPIDTRTIQITPAPEPEEEPSRGGALSSEDAWGLSDGGI